MTHQAQNTERLDRMARSAGAFSSWDDLAAKIHSGYTPTLSPRSACATTLAMALKVHGLPAWNPETGANW